MTLGGMPLLSWAGLLSLVISLVTVAHTYWFVNRSARYRAESAERVKQLAQQLATAIEENIALTQENIRLYERLKHHEITEDGNG